MTQTILITGASSGIGAGLAREYARRGDRLALVARRLDLLETLRAELRALGAEVTVHQGDVTRDGEVARVVDDLASRGLGLNVVYANAGFGVAGNVQKLSIDDYQRQFDTNVFGVLRTVKETVPALRARGGQLVLVGSVAGHAASAGMSAYSMSKFAVRALAETLHGDLAPEGIRVTLVSPGFVDSDIRRTNNQGVVQTEAKDPIPAWLRVSTEKAAREIVRGVDRGKAEIVVTGHGKVIVFIARHFPGLLRWAGLRVYKGRPEPSKGVTTPRFGG
ncbi:MAG: SDR family NAD(P)-dependent oxidoreductase [Gammaproteobacteria bacterium]|nr:SDR family NAD(P)-dependent oxidoreductase [Gammaproteobacteria bacterium]